MAAVEIMCPSTFFVKLCKLVHHSSLILITLSVLFAVERSLWSLELKADEGVLLPPRLPRLLLLLPGSEFKKLMVLTALCGG